jgi:hypothetical protein
MKNSTITRLGKSFAAASLVALAIMAISSCGGGDGDGATNRDVIAPESLENVKINFFDAFTIECYRLSGTAGNESGAGDYDRLKEAFTYANPDGVGYSIKLPISLENFRYQYQRTGVDTGRVTLFFENNIEYPIKKANKNETRSVGQEMFWGGPGLLATDLTVDILFTQQGNILSNGSARIRHFYYYESFWTGGDGGFESSTTTPNEFDATDVKFSKVDGTAVPAGYNPYSTITDKSPSSVVMTSLDAKTFNLLDPSIIDPTTGRPTIVGKIAFQKGTGLGPEIPGGVRAEESGTILVTDTPEVTSPPIYNGTYSYARTGGAYAKLAVEYTKTGVGLVKENYVLQFLSLDNGSYTTSTGGIGEFENDLFSP